MTLSVEAFDHIVINVRDVEAAAEWYQRVLGMKREDKERRPGKMRTSVHFGRQKINLRPASSSQQDWITGKQVTAGSDDLCFLTKATPQQVVEHFKACGVAIEEGPSEKQGAMGALVSVYCRDPDGNLIEVSSYK
jgi:catechol 2,3-dioxygenase-like lactoylglutathione lyase family enzyme